jgi:hypothetical protein
MIQAFWGKPMTPWISPLLQREGLPDDVIAQIGVMATRTTRLSTHLAEKLRLLAASILCYPHCNSLLAYLFACRLDPLNREHMYVSMGLPNSNLHELLKYMEDDRLGWWNPLGIYLAMDARKRLQLVTRFCTDQAIT